MQTRPFGRTGHQSTVAIFGSAALWDIAPAAADVTIQAVLDAGVNHFDVAPSYGQAEQHLGRWMPRIRERIFLGCKTMERTRTAAHAEMRNSLKLLNVDNFDLYQMHAVTTLAELDEVTRIGGSLETAIAARTSGITRFIGLTTHGYDAPLVGLEALRRFDFDSLLFPYNFILAADETYRARVDELLGVCAERNVGTMIIKSVARARWGEREHTLTTWYEPFESETDIQSAVNFVLSQPVTGICTAGDVTVLPRILAACAAFTPLDAAAQQALIDQAGQHQALFLPGQNG